MNWKKILIDMVKEQQAKLGFRPEVIRLYYPVSTLNHFFGTDDTPERMEERLQELESTRRIRLELFRDRKRGPVLY